MWLKLLRAGPVEWFAMVEAQLWVIWAHIRVRVTPRGRLVSRTDRPASRIPSGPLSPKIDRIVSAISRVSRFGVSRPECLVRSIALQRMLSFHGVDDALVRFGVRTRDGEFESHAWVEHGGRVLGDDLRHVRTFSVLDPLTITKPRGG